MKSFAMLFAITMICQIFVTETSACNPKIDPGCNVHDPSTPIAVVLEPIPDPVSTPDAQPVAKPLCDQKTDPSCN